MADALQVIIHGEDKLDRDLGVYADRLRRPFQRGGARARAIQYVTNESRRQITEGQRGDYKPLSPRYRAWKEKKYPGRPTLVITGRTVRSMTNSKSRDFYSKVRGGGKVLEMGTKYSISAYHQKGTKRMPARPLFRLTRRVAERMAEVIGDALTKGLR